MKIVLMLVIVLMFLYIGFGIRKNMKKRERLLNQIVLFLRQLLRDIGFLQKDLHEIVTKLIQSNDDNEFKIMLNSFNEYLVLKNEASLRTAINKSSLNTEDQEQFYQFLLMLGKEEASAEVYKIKNDLLYFEQRLEKVRGYNAKYCPMAIKLSLLTSLAICVILI